MATCALRLQIFSDLDEAKAILGSGLVLASALQLLARLAATDPDARDTICTLPNLENVMKLDIIGYVFTASHIARLAMH